MDGKHAPSPLELPQAQALLKDPTALRALLRSPQAKALLELMAKQGDVNDAARRAKNGDTQALQAMLRQVGSSRQGARVLDDLRQKLPG